MKLNSQIAQTLHKRFNKGLKTKDAIGISLALHLFSGDGDDLVFCGYDCRDNAARGIEH